MTKLRITNKAKGPRGIWINGALEEVTSGATRTFSNATAADIAAASNVKDFRVQSGEDGAWEELSQEDAPAQHPYLVIATDSQGGNMRFIELREGEWFIGSAVASERPEKAGGYSYSKIGGTFEAPLTEQAAMVTGDFVPLEYLNQPVAKLEFEGRSPEVLEALLEAEKSDDGKQRKGVIATLEEMLTEPKPGRIDFDVTGVSQETLKKALEK